MSAEISLLTNDFLAKQTEESWETWVAVKRQTRTLKYQYESPVRELKWPPPRGGGTYCLLFHAREVWYRTERSGVIRMGTIIHSISGPIGLHVPHELQKLLRYMQEWGVLVNFSVDCINISNESICNRQTERNHNKFKRGKMDKREPCRITREEKEYSGRTRESHVGSPGRRKVGRKPPILTRTVPWKPSPMGWDHLWLHTSNLPASTLGDTLLSYQKPPGKR